MQTFRKLPTTVPITKKPSPRTTRIGHVEEHGDGSRRVEGTRGQVARRSAQGVQQPRMASATSSGVLPPVSITASASSW